MKVIRGDMVKKLRSLVPFGERTRRRNLLIFGTIYFDEFKPLFEENNLKCPIVNLEVFGAGISWYSEQSSTTNLNLCWKKII